MNIVQNKRQELALLCEKFSVEKMYVFGSATSAELTDESDIDFLISFKETPLSKYADNYFGLLESLEQLFKRNIDLVTERSLSNPYLIKSINESKQLLYAA